MSIEYEYPVTRIVTMDVADTPELTGDSGIQGATAQKDNRTLASGLGRDTPCPLVSQRTHRLLALRSERTLTLEELPTSVRQSYKRASGGSSDTGIALRCRRYRLPSWPIPPGRVRQWSRDPGYNGTAPDGAPDSPA